MAIVESCYAIGEPGRAATEVTPGSPISTPAWPDTVLDAASVGGFEVRAASLRGVLHRYLNTARQDGYSLAWLEDRDSLLITVCDGLGSFEASRAAAELVAARMPKILGLEENDQTVDWVTAFTTVSAELDDLIVTSGAAMATTAMCALIRGDDDGRYCADIGWVGDCGAYLLTPSGWVVVGGAVKTAEPVGAPLSSATAALPDADIIVGSRLVEFGADTALFLMTDGVADPLGSGQGEVGETLMQWWADPPPALQFAAQVGFSRKSFDDDRTVVGVWPTSRNRPQ